MEYLASILPECPHLSFWQVHRIKGGVPRAVLIPHLPSRLTQSLVAFHLL